MPAKEKIAAGTFPYSKYSIDYALDSLLSLGFDRAEVYCSYPHLNLEDSGLACIPGIKSKLRERNIQVVCLTPQQMKYPVNIAASDQARRKRSLELMETVLCAAAELDCPLALIHGGFPLNDEKEEDAWNRSSQSLAYLNHRAECLGVDIVLETVDVRWKTLLRNSSKAAEMIRQLGAKRIHGMIDFMTMSHSGETPEEVYKNLRGDIAHCHFSDGYSGSKKMSHLIPGDGELDLDRMLRELDSLEYKGFLSIELTDGYEDDPHSAMRRSKEWLESRLN